MHTTKRRPHPLAAAGATGACRRGTLSERIRVPLLLLLFAATLISTPVVSASPKTAVAVAAADVSLNDATTGTAANQFEFVGSWIAGADIPAYQGNHHYTKAAGTSYRVRFSGTQVKIYATTAPNQGIQAVSIDGGPETMVDLYSASRAHQVLVYTSPVLADATHTLKVRVTGTKNGSASDSFVVADRVDVTLSTAPPPPPPPPADAGTFNDATTGTAANQFEFVGSWIAGADIPAYQGNHHYTKAAGTSYQVRFSGTQVKIYATTAPNQGIQAVSTDGGPETMVDLYSASRAHQVLVYTSPVLADATHTLKVRVTGTKNGSASDSFVVADRVDVTLSTAPPPPPPPPADAGTFNDATTGTAANQFEFVGSWIAGADIPAYQGNHHYTKAAGTSYQVRFSGTQVKIYATTAPNQGIQAVSTDGGPETMVDLYSASRAHQVLVYTSPVLADATHTLKVRVTGTKNGSASDSFVVADRVDVTLSTAPPPPPPPPDAWQNVASTDFTTDGVLPAPWKAYNFANSVASGGYYLASHAVVSGGMVKLVQKYESSGPARNPYYSSTGAGWYQGTIYASGGGVDSVDHRTTVRMRIVSTNGITSHRNLPLWWPNSGNAPLDGEEDFFETDGAWWPAVNGVEQPRSFFHYSSTNRFVYWIWTPIDVTQWHTYRFERRNHKITIWVDDMTTPIWSQQYSSTELPDTIKHPTFQQENPNFVPPAGTTGSEEIQIDSIQIDVPS